MTRLGTLLVRHLTLLTFVLIGVAVLAPPSTRAHSDPRPGYLTAAADPTPADPNASWFSPGGLAGIAAVLAAVADGAAKVIRAYKDPAQAAACPFTGPDGLCHRPVDPHPPS